jgi:hypothetical protein
MRKFAFGEFYSGHSGQFSEFTVPHFLLAGADEAIE